MEALVRGRSGQSAIAVFGAQNSWCFNDLRGNKGADSDAFGPFARILSIWRRLIGISSHGPRLRANALGYFACSSTQHNPTRKVSIHDCPFHP